MNAIEAVEYIHSITWMGSKPGLERTEELLRLMEEDGIRDGGLYHFDTPLTLAHETQALTEGGFSQVVLLGTWGATRCIKATKLPVDPSKLGDH